jgi:hypothetical protein
MQMSTKIYDGVRIPIDKIADFTKFFDARCLDFIVKQTEELMVSVKEEIVTEEAKNLPGLIGDKSIDEFLKDGGDEYIRYLYVAKMYTVAMKKKVGFLNPDSWFSAFPLGEYFYIVPGFPTGFSLSVHEKTYPGYVEEYGYWNNADPPEDVEWEDFKLRGKNWEKCGALDIPQSNQLLHNLIELSNVSNPLIKIEQRVFKNPANKKRWPASYIAYDKVINSSDIVEQTLEDETNEDT